MTLPQSQTVSTSAKRARANGITAITLRILAVEIHYKSNKRKSNRVLLLDEGSDRST
jgi:hypothetical protein